MMNHLLTLGVGVASDIDEPYNNKLTNNNNKQKEKQRNITGAQFSLSFDRHWEIVISSADPLADIELWSNGSSFPMINFI